MSGYNSSMPASFKYREIADHVARGIQAGVTGPGERLPSLRDVCRTHGASLMTALAAYRHLEALGLVEAVPRSGFRVKPRLPVALHQPAIRRARISQFRSERAELTAQLLAAMADPGLVPLGSGWPSADLYPLPAFRRLTSRLLRSERNPWTSFSPPRGDPELRRLIAQRYQARGMDVRPDDVLVTTGAMEALTLALRRVVKPGDVVAVDCPAFFGILDAARNAGARVMELPAEPEGGPDPAVFAAMCRRHTVRAVVLSPTFANPTGSLMNEERKAAWMEVLQAERVALIEDDVYGEFAWDGRRHVPLCATARRDDQPSILVGSFSKTLLPGGRLGYAIAQSPWVDGLADLKSTSTLANAPLPQALVAECLASGVYDRHLRCLRPRLQAGVHAMRALVARHFPPGTRVSDPQGGYFLWVELPKGKGVDGLGLFHAAVGQGVGSAPGCLFSLGGGLDRFVRLNAAVTGDMEAAVRTLGRLAATVHSRAVGA
jgi:DNA-binding transcriptional MocR family regulator